MIPFASQRAGSQDLATHLMNEHDNEYMELADLRGALADDLHGAFAEWEAQASAMTKCRNFLYSLSVNPDPAQGAMPRELYDDYIARVETALGLDGQPRAIVFHIKEDKRGEGREHCHVVWSRIDVQEGRAIQLSFDHDKLMSVTRQFARDHDIELAPGYHRLEDRKRQTYRQLSLYEKAQEDTLGISKEERWEIVTELWRHRDAPEAFIKALEYHGYILATGKRPFALVDIYGHVNSLPKLIDDKSANTKAIREFLGDEYSAEYLPSVEHGKELASQHRQALKDFKVSQARADKTENLKEHQERRRAKMEREAEALKERHRQHRAEIAAAQQAERSALKGAYLERSRSIKAERFAAQPTGLAAFLSRVSGVELVRRKIHKYQDRKRFDAFTEEKQLLQDRQGAEASEFRRAHEMQALDLERKRRGLAQTEQREMKSLQQSFERQRHIQNRKGHDHLPALALHLKPPGRPAAPHKAMNRYTSELGRELNKAGQVGTPRPSVQPEGLQDAFTRAVGSVSESGDTAAGDSGRSSVSAPQPEQPSREFTRKGTDNDRGRKG